MRKYVVSFILGVLLVFLVMPSAHAALIPCDGVGPDKCEVKDLIGLLIGIYNFLLGLAGIVALLVIILSGFTMLIYSYFENATGVLAGAKLTLTRAITGLVIVISAYLIVNTVIVLLGGGGIDEIIKKLF